MRQSILPIPEGRGYLFTVLHEPVTDAKDELFIFMHGFGMFKEEHLSLYSRMAQLMALEGYHSILFDYRGCGDSSGELKDVTVGTMMEDIRFLIGYARETYPRLRISLIARGISVPIATYMTLDWPVNRLICIGTAGSYCPSFELMDMKENSTGHDFCYGYPAQTIQRIQWLNQLGCIPFFISAERITRKFCNEVPLMISAPIPPETTSEVLWFIGNHSKGNANLKARWHRIDYDMESKAPRFNPTNHAGIGDEIITTALGWLKETEFQQMEAT